MKFKHYFKIVENGYIVSINGGNILPKDAVPLKDEAEYKALLKYINEERPEDTLEAVYRLSNETEEYVACERTHEESVDWYVQAVSSGTMTIEDVPEEYRAEVEGRLPQPEEQKYTLDEAATLLAQEVNA